MLSAQQLVACVLLTALLAGCASGPSGEPAPTNASEGSAFPEFSESTGGTEPSDSTPKTIRVLIDYEGDIGSENCVPSGPGGCRSVAPSSGSANNPNNSTVFGEPLQVVAALWWNSTESATSTLIFQFGAVRTEANGNGYQSVGQQSARGSSPLILNLTEFSWPDGEWSPGFQVDAPNPYPSPLYGKQHGQQAFHVVGYIVGLDTGDPTRIGEGAWSVLAKDTE